MKIIITLFTLFICITNSLAQDAFCKSYSHKSYFNRIYLTRFAKCSDGGYAVITKDDNDDLELMRMDEDGNVMWGKTYKGSYYGYRTSIIEANTGDFFFSATLKDTSSILDKGVHRLFKVNSFGELQWSKDIQNSEDQSVSEAIVELGGYVYAVGHSRNESHFYKASITKMDFSGDVIWQKSYAGETDQTIPVDAVATDDNGIIIACQSGLGSIVYKVNNDGAVLWFKSIHQDYLSQVKDIELTSNNELLITGRYREHDACSWHDIFSMRLSSEGEHIWGNIYSTNIIHLHGHTIHETSDGGSIMVGQQEEYWNLNYPILIETNEFGRISSQRALRPDVSSTAVASVKNNDGSLTLLGVNSRWADEGRQTMLTKTDTEFITICEEENIFLYREPFFNGTSNTYTVTDFESITTTTVVSEDYLIASSLICGEAEDDVTAGNIETINEAVTNSNCFPNPTTDKINFTVIPNQVIIFDMSGRELFRGANIASIYLLDFPKGCYIVHQEFQGYSINEKIIKE